MEMSAPGENKQLKYNHVAPIDLDSIPADELEQALIEFAEGSVGLENCLRIMWANGMKTFACCAGERDEDDIAYISMCEGVDLFKYLSDDLLLNEMVALEDEGHQLIRFAGEVDEKDRLMQRLAEDVASGVKDNARLLQEKIGKDFPEEWYRERNARAMKRHGMSDEDIAARERQLKLFKIMETGSQEEMDAVMPEFMEMLTSINQKRVVNHEEKKK